MVRDAKTGRRQRLKERFLEEQAESRSDELLLELLLTFAIGRRDLMLQIAQRYYFYRPVACSKLIGRESISDFVLRFCR